NFFAIMATSVSVESLFSSARQLCDELRGSMKAETVAMSKHWIKDGLFFFN
ncbi:hypothetical protein C8J56DRAFT_778162, partial [Mycena floridula]